MLRRVSRLVEEMRIYEARTVLLEAGAPPEELRDLEREIANLEDEMRAWKSPAPKRRPAPLGADRLPSGVQLLEREEGAGRGLRTQRLVHAGEVVFAETPLAVVTENEGCAHCLRPLAPRRACGPDGSEVAASGESLLQMCGLPALALSDSDHLCSRECRAVAPHSHRLPRLAADEEPAAWLARRLDSKSRRLVERHLAGDDLASICKRNVLEVSTHGMAALMHPGGSVEPVADDKLRVDGTALFLVASLINHSCVAANLAPLFLDSLQDTPFVATCDIPAGEELLFDYASTVEDKRDKRIRNYLAHGFVCKC